MVEVVPEEHAHAVELALFCGYNDGTCAGVLARERAAEDVRCQEGEEEASCKHEIADVAG